MLDIVALVILLALSGLFSASETALFSLSRMKLRVLLRKKKRGAEAVQKLKEKPDRMIITILIGNNVVNIGAAALATAITINIFGSTGVGIATGIMTALVLVFGEIIPKSFASKHAVGFSLFMGRILLVLSYILYPIVVLLEAFTKVVTGKGGKSFLTEEEIKSLLEIGAEERVIEEREKELMKGVLQFNDITSEDVMTPRTEMFCLDGEMNITEAVRAVLKKPYSRIPVIEEDKDKVIGVLYVRDLLKMMEKGVKNTKIKTIAQLPFFVPKEVIISELFKEFQRRHVHIAIVVDEYGGTEGLVTMEDLLEELVGEIIDESDVSEELIKRIDKKTILVHPKTEIKDINDFFNIQLPEKAGLTVGVLMLKKLKKLPKRGSRVRIGKVILTVRKMGRKRIEEILIKKV